MNTPIYDALMAEFIKKHGYWHGYWQGATPLPPKDRHRALADRWRAYKNKEK